jgi:hypothetical protein
MDVRHIEAIHRKFGERPLVTLPLMSPLKYGIEYILFRGLQIAKPLNYLHYDKAEVMKLLKVEFDWQYYGGKHFESRWTRFFQGWWLPTRFGYDKRLAHLSSLIITGQISRQEALKEMETECYTQQMMEEDRELILKKLDMSLEEWTKLLNSPVHSHDEYAQSTVFTKLMIFGLNALRHIGLLS